MAKQSVITIIREKFENVMRVHIGERTPLQVADDLIDELLKNNYKIFDADECIILKKSEYLKQPPLEVSIFKRLQKLKQELIQLQQVHSSLVALLFERIDNAAKCLVGMNYHINRSQETQLQEQAPEEKIPEKC